MSSYRSGRTDPLPGRKAAVEVQFNWIFIVIAGAVILSIFAAIVLKQKTVSEAASRATLLNVLSAIAAGSEAASGVMNVLELPEASIEFECNLIHIGAQSQQFQQMMLFAPSVARTSPLLVQTKEWSIPYRITNVVYFSTPKIRYILVGSSPLAKAINKSLPAALNVEFYPALPTSLRIQNADHTRVVFAGASPQFPAPLSKIDDDKMSALAITGDGSGGTISFYRKSETRWDLVKTYPYLRQEMLLGAVLTDDPGQYACIATNMFRKVDLVTDIYQRRAAALAETPSLARCQSLYTDAQQHFSVIRGAASGFNEGSVQQASQALSSLEITNTQLQRQSCPLLY